MKFYLYLQVESYWSFFAVIFNLMTLALTEFALTISQYILVLG